MTHLRRPSMAVLLILVLGLLLIAGYRSRAQQQVSGPSLDRADPGLALPGVGDTVKFQGWEVTLLAFGPAERAAPDDQTPAPPQGVLVVADLQLRNIQLRPASFTPSDFVLRAGDGRVFRPAPETTTLERGLAAREEVPSGQATERRVAFELAADADSLVLEALEIEFNVPAPGR